MQPCIVHAIAARERAREGAYAEDNAYLCKDRAVKLVRFVFVSHHPHSLIQLPAQDGVVPNLWDFSQRHVPSVYIARDARTFNTRVTRADAACQRRLQFPPPLAFPNPKTCYAI